MSAAETTDLLLAKASFPVASEKAPRQTTTQRGVGLFARMLVLHENLPLGLPLITLDGSRRFVVKHHGLTWADVGQAIPDMSRSMSLGWLLDIVFQRTCGDDFQVWETMGHVRWVVLSNHELVASGQCFMPGVQSHVAALVSALAWTEVRQ